MNRLRKRFLSAFMALSVALPGSVCYGGNGDKFKKDERSSSPDGSCTPSDKPLSVVYYDDLDVEEMKAAIDDIVKKAVESPGSLPEIPHKFKFEGPSSDDDWINCFAFDFKGFINYKGRYMAARFLRLFLNFVHMMQQESLPKNERELYGFLSFLILNMCTRHDESRYESWYRLLVPYMPKKLEKYRKAFRKELNEKLDSAMEQQSLLSVREVLNCMSKANSYFKNIGGDWQFKCINYILGEYQSVRVAYTVDMNNITDYFQAASDPGMALTLASISYRIYKKAMDSSEMSKSEKQTLERNLFKVWMGAVIFSNLYQALYNLKRAQNSGSVVDVRRALDILQRSYDLCVDALKLGRRDEIDKTMWEGCKKEVLAAIQSATDILPKIEQADDITNSLDESIEQMRLQKSSDSAHHAREVCNRYVEFLRSVGSELSFLPAPKKEELGQKFRVCLAVIKDTETYCALQDLAHEVELRINAVNVNEADTIVAADEALNKLKIRVSSLSPALKSSEDFRKLQEQISDYREKLKYARRNQPKGDRIITKEEVREKSDKWNAEVSEKQKQKSAVSDVSTETVAGETNVAEPCKIVFLHDPEEKKPLGYLANTQNYDPDAWTWWYNEAQKGTFYGGKMDLSTDPSAKIYTNVDKLELNIEKRSGAPYIYEYVGGRTAKTYGLRVVYYVEEDTHKVVILHVGKPFGCKEGHNNPWITVNIRKNWVYDFVNPDGTIDTSKRYSPIVRTPSSPVDFSKLGFNGKCVKG